ncbi:ninja-family protein 4-like [Triticum dicoccoides]|uniref:ninja-family protein 4-like n=1 Tax=Triticum dicoccoides TaxID=85692 RepID=UPI000E7C7048|nr:ninja-family protein 4-like [Triticum dicoccoides]
MDAYSKDSLRGVGGGDDGEKKVKRSESGTEEVDLTLGLSLGGRLGAKRRRLEGHAGSSSAAPAPPAPVGTNSSQGTGFPPNGVAVEPSALLRATLNPFPGSAGAAGVQPSATPLISSIKQEPVEGTARADGRSLSSAVVPRSVGTNGVMPTTSSLASAVMMAAILGTRGASQRALAREMPLVWTSGLHNGMRTVGFLYQYSRVDELRIMCVCHGSFLTPAEFVEHAGGGRVANPLRSIIVKTPSWL